MACFRGVPRAGIALPLTAKACNTRFRHCTVIPGNSAPQQRFRSILLLPQRCGRIALIRPPPATRKEERTDESGALVLAVWMLFFSTAAQADVVCSQPLTATPTGQSGFVSDPSFNQLIADNFTVASPASVTDVQWYGAYNSSATPPVGSINFSIRFYSTSAFTPATLISNQAVSVAGVSAGFNNSGATPSWFMTVPSFRFRSMRGPLIGSPLSKPTVRLHPPGTGSLVIWEMEPSPVQMAVEPLRASLRWPVGIRGWHSFSRIFLPSPNPPA